MSPAVVLNLLISVAFAAIRLVGHKSDLFKDSAHIYIGGLFAWALCELRLTKGKALDVVIEAWALIVIAIVLSLVELGKGLFDRFLSLGG